MNIGIVYISKRGSTEKLAQKIGEVLNVEPYNVLEPHSLSDKDLLFVGTGIYEGKPAPEIINYIDNLPGNSIKGAVIFSANKHAKDETELLVNCLKSKGIEVYPKRFICKGKGVLFGHHPDEKDLSRLEEFVKDVIKSI